MLGVEFRSAPDSEAKKEEGGHQAEDYQDAGTEVLR